MYVNFNGRDELDKIRRGRKTKVPPDFIAELIYGKFGLMGELEKYVRGKRTRVPAWLLAKLALDEIRSLRRAVNRDKAVEELTRLYSLEDPRQ